MSTTQYLDSLPLIAILRGITPDAAVKVAGVVHAAGIRIIEVPLNSPEPLLSIQKINGALGEACLCGAGTVLSAQEVQSVHHAGGRLVVAPNMNSGVITRALRLGMTVIPGIATATEAFAAVQCGATALKLFPAATYGPGHLKSLKDVLPKDTRILPVGGIGADDIAAWRNSGAQGFGFGSEIFRPDYTLDEIARRAQRVVAAFAAVSAA